MKKNILLDPLPTSVSIDGISYPINWGYRAGILEEMAIYASDRSEEQKMLDVLNIFYNRNIPPDLNEAQDEFLKFYAAEDSGDSDSSSQARSSRRKSGQRGYCFEQDSSLIYAAFLSQYGINLNRTKNKELHWWEFKALFSNLNHEQKISQIMEWRLVSLKDVPKHERKFVKRMKQRYAIRGERSTMDAKMRLLKRNADMKEYVRRRYAECKINE